jgi:hypothetical protein
MIFRPSRARRDDRFLDQKMLIFAVGAVVAIGGMAFELGWLVYVAIGIFAIGLLLRFLPDGGK